MRECTECGATYGDEVLFCSIDESPTTPKLQPPSTRRSVAKAGDVLGNYQLKELLGVGGMGLVFLAEHTLLKRKVALKLLRPDLAYDPVAIQRFFAEARAVNQIAHENIVEVTDFVEEGDHRYFVMELLQGHVLAEALRDGRLPLPRAVHIARQIAAALGATHDAGVIHRDMKPDNIFLIRRGADRDFVKVLDFGVAKVSGLERDAVEKTAAGSLLGTPAYMAPEQLSQKPVDHRVDIYALGVLMFELVVGRRPFQGTSIGEIIVQQLTHPAPRPSVVMQGTGEGLVMPEALEALILSCLEKDPDKRPQTMRAIVDALGGIDKAVRELSRAGADDEAGGDGGTGDYALPSSGGWIVVPAQRDQPVETSGANTPAPGAAPAPIALPATTPAQAEPEQLDEVEDFEPLDDPAEQGAAAFFPAAPATTEAPAAAPATNDAAPPSGTGTNDAAPPPGTGAATTNGPAPPSSTGTNDAAPPSGTASKDAPATNAAETNAAEATAGDDIAEKTAPTGAHDVLGDQAEVRYPIARPPASRQPRARRTRSLAIAAGVIVVVGVVAVVAVVALSPASGPDTSAGGAHTGDAAAHARDDGAGARADEGAAHAAATHADEGAARAPATQGDEGAAHAAATHADEGAAHAAATHADEGAAHADEGAAHRAAAKEPGRAAAAPERVSVRFSSKPPGATVVVAGHTIGKTPLSAPVPAGRHTVAFKLAGYATRMSMTTLAEGAAVDAVLVMKQPKAAPAEDLKSGGLINPFKKN